MLHMVMYRRYTLQSSLRASSTNPCWCSPNPRGDRFKSSLLLHSVKSQWKVTGCSRTDGLLSRNPCWVTESASRWYKHDLHSQLNHIWRNDTASSPKASLKINGRGPAIVHLYSCDVLMFFCCPFAFSLFQEFHLALNEQAILMCTSDISKQVLTSSSCWAELGEE